MKTPFVYIFILCALITNISFTHAARDSKEIEVGSAGSTNSATTTISSTDNTNSNMAATTTAVCEAQKKINTKREKISKQIKKQIQDKNKLVESLLSIASSSEVEARDKIENKVLVLEEKVSEVIKSQKELMDMIYAEDPCDTAPHLASSTRASSTQSKTEENRNKNIKKIEQEINIRNAEINNLIKIDIKKILKDIK